MAAGKGKGLIGQIRVYVLAVTKRFERGMKRTETTVKRTRKTVIRLGRAIRRMALRALGPVKLLRRAFTKLWTSVRGVLRIMGGPLGRIGWFGGLGIVGGLTLAGAMAIKTAASFETLHISFKTMLRSGEQASKLLRNLEKFAARTPFRMTELAQSARQLLAVGVSADQILPTLRVLGDVTAGLGLSLVDMAWLYAQTRVEQRLMAKDLKQFSSRAIPINKELQKAFGKTGAEIRKMASESKINFQDVQRAFEKMTGKGGIFYGLIGALSQSTEGLFSTLLDNVEMFARDIGKFIIEEFGVKDMMRSMIARMQALRPQIIELLRHIAVSVHAIISAIVKAMPHIINMVAKLVHMIMWSIREVLNASEFWIKGFSKMAHAWQAAIGMVVSKVTSLNQKLARIPGQIGRLARFRLLVIRPGATEEEKSIVRVRNATIEFINAMQELGEVVSNELKDISKDFKKLWKVITTPIDQNILDDLLKSIDVGKFKIDEYTESVKKALKQTELFQSGTKFAPAIEVGSPEAVRAQWRASNQFQGQSGMKALVVIQKKASAALGEMKHDLKRLVRELEHIKVLDAAKSGTGGMLPAY